MDYRRRNYYLVKFDWSSKDMRLEYLKIACEKLKIHAPYNHIRINTRDSIAESNENVFFPEMMISCLKEDSEAVEYELRKSERRDKYSKFVKLTKEICKQ